MTTRDRALSTGDDGIADGRGDYGSGVQSQWIAGAGLLGAIAASSCCAVPLILFSLGISGAWIGNLTALEPYKPLFIATTLCVLGYGYWRVYRKPVACDGDAACARPLPSRFVRLMMWMSSALVLIALFWNWIAPIIAPLVLNR